MPQKLHALQASTNPLDFSTWTKCSAATGRKATRVLKNAQGSLPLHCSSQHTAVTAQAPCRCSGGATQQQSVAQGLAQAPLRTRLLLKAQGSLQLQADVTSW